MSLSTVAVVGASLAGLRSAETLRELGYDGRLVLVGAEHHLPYDRPPLSKQLLVGKWGEDRILLRSEDRLAALECELRLGVAATALDLAERSLLLADGERLGFDGLVIATGARPRELRGFEPLDGVFLLRTLDDARALRAALLVEGARVVVVGGGFIGCEVASSASQLGRDVTVVEALSTPLERVLGPQVGAACAGVHLDHGVHLRTGVGVAALRGSRRVEEVVLSDGSALAADVVVVGIGVEPVTGWLEGSGLSLGDGLRCDAALVAAPGVVGAGDVVRWPHPAVAGTLRLEHWENAAAQGAHAAASLLVPAEERSAFAPIPYFWSDQFDAKIQYVGITEPTDAVAVVDGSFDSRRFVACYGRSGRFVGAVAIGRPRHLIEYRRLLVDGASFEQACAFRPF